jgi:hypothetical protein
MDVYILFKNFNSYLTKNAHLLYIDRPGSNAIHCQTQKKRRNALCRRNVEILKPTQVLSVKFQHRECITAINISARAPTHTQTHTGKNVP